MNESEIMNEHDIVIAKRDLSDLVPSGCIGVIVMVFGEPPAAYLVEFFDEEDYTLDVLRTEVDDVELYWKNIPFDERVIVIMNEYDSVLARRNLSNLVPRGCRGTIVRVYQDPNLTYEVEFFDEDGNTLDVLKVDEIDVELNLNPAPLGKSV